MELLVESLLLLFTVVLRGSLDICISKWWSLGGILKALVNISLEILVDLSFNLGKILVDILVSSLESLLGEFGNLTGHHALLILEEAIRSSKEAIKGHNFLKESKL